MPNSEWGNGTVGDKKNKLARVGTCMAGTFRSWEKFKIVTEISWKHGAAAGTHNVLRRHRERRGPDLDCTNANE